jgi:succinyl-CoA synthetase beta subunit
MNIEEVAEETPEHIVTMPISINTGMTVSQSEEMARKIHFTGASVGKAAANMRALYDLFLKNDATQVSSSYERHPLSPPSHYY